MHWSTLHLHYVVSRRELVELVGFFNAATRDKHRMCHGGWHSTENGVRGLQNHSKTHSASRVKSIRNSKPG